MARMGFTLMFWQKLTLVALLLLIVNLGVFTIPCWQALIVGEDGFSIIMTQYIGLFEQVGDVIILTASLILGIASAVWLFKFIYM